MADDVADFLILGGGSAGSALAARLSEDANNQVVLVEAGRDLRPETMSDAIRSRYPGYAFLDEENIWPALVARLGASQGNTPPQPVRYEQARVLGGGSAINAMVANRGAPGDYDEWGALGAAGWSWSSVLPYFRKLERDCDFDNDYHGQSGPIPVRRLPPERVSPFVKAVCKSLVDRGYPQYPDQNGQWTDGVFPTAIATTDDGERIPASIAYLTPEVRRRPNLRIITGMQAERVVFDGTRAVGADIAPAQGAKDGGGARRIAARQVIVSCGGLHTPALLMRSGAGSAAELQALDIPMVAHVPGIGRNLMEHPLIAVSTYLPAKSRLADTREHHGHALLRFSSKIADAPEGDMHMAILGRTGWHAVGRRLGTTLVWVNKSYSRGSVTLASKDPRDEPVVDFQLLSDWRDLERLKAGLLLGARTLSDPLLDGVRGEVFPTTFSERVRKVMKPGPVNALQMSVFASMLDLSFGLRRSLIERFITSGVRLDDLVRDDGALTDFVRRSVGAIWHASGTCRMGTASDPMAVTDEAGRVRGVEGLRVCDASLMPSIPRANTNMPTLMIAERIADLIREGA